MAWSASAMFTQFITNPGLTGITAVTKPTGFTSLTADAIKAALFNNTGTPNKDDTLANCAYNAGQWVTANEVTDATNWVAGGRAMSGLAFSAGTGSNAFTASNTAGGGTLTISNAYGCLVYDSSITGGTVAKQGICFNYFGGANSVTGGTFTILWNASGVWQITN